MTGALELIDSKTKRPNGEPVGAFFLKAEVREDSQPTRRYELRKLKPD